MSSALPLPIPRSTALTAALTLAIAGCLLSTPLGAAVVLPAPQQVDWILYSSNNCNQPPPASKSASCGNYGTFYFGPNLGLNCHIKAIGSEIPVGYNVPGQEAVQSLALGHVIRNQANAAGGLGTLPPPPPPPPPSVPCADESCLSDPGGADGQQPWMMILDWTQGPRKNHGLMMAAIASQVWGDAVSIFGIDDPLVTTLLGEGAGDAHLIHNLCQVVDQVHAGTLRAPTALSMSLGRFDEPADAGSTACDKTTLSCQLARVIKRLKNRGTLPFAASGNYTLREFPGDLSNVTEVGNLDMAKYQAFGELEPTWETPDSALLAPGYGVCVEWQHNNETLLYPTAGGTSYSGVIAASLIARATEDYQLTDPMAQSWDPVWQPNSQNGAGCFEFGDLQPPYCNPVADRMIKRMTGFPLPKCWSPEISAGVLELSMPNGGPLRGVTDGKPGLTECFYEEHLPKPTNDLCVPCGMEEDSKSGHSRFSKIGAIVIDNLVDLVLDISGTVGLEDGLEISEVFIRFENSQGIDDFYRILGPDNAAVLALLAAAQYQTLVVHDFLAFLPTGSQPSLVAFYDQESTVGGSGPQCWHSSPLVLMGRQNHQAQVP